MKREQEKISKEMNEAFEMDLSFVQDEYYTKVQNMMEKYSILTKDYCTACGSLKQELSQELTDIIQQITQWNLFVESYMDKYSDVKTFVRKLESYKLTPQR